MEELVSVIIPSHERYDLLNKAIDSVVNQTYKKIEIIVINDYSKDERYDNFMYDKRLTYVKTSGRLGFPGKVRNIGISHSKGEWISFLDDDDFWLPNKLEKQLSYSNTHSFMCSEAIEDGINYVKNRHLNVWHNTNPNNSNILDHEIISRHNLIICSSVLVKKEILEKVGWFNEDKRFGEDYDTWLKITKNNIPCFFVDEPLMCRNSNTHKHYYDNF